MFEIQHSNDLNNLYALHRRTLGPSNGNVQIL